MDQTKTEEASVQTFISERARDIVRGIYDEPHKHMFVDFETTGLDGYIVQVGLFSSGLEYQVTINPNSSIEESAQIVHGMSDDDVRIYEPLFNHIFYICDRCKGQILVAYRASFEKKILSNEADRCGWDTPMGGAIGRLLHQPWIDLAEMYAQWIGVHKDDGSLKYWKLHGDHTALGDCYAMLDIVRHMNSRTTPAFYTPGDGIW